MLILFVEYHASFRQSASYLMDQEDDMEVVSQAGSVAGGRQKMAEGGIDAAVVDLARRHFGFADSAAPPVLTARMHAC